MSIEPSFHINIQDKPESKIGMLQTQIQLLEQAISGSIEKLTLINTDVNTLNCQKIDDFIQTELLSRIEFLLTFEETLDFLLHHVNPLNKASIAEITLRILQLIKKYIAFIKKLEASHDHLKQQLEEKKEMSLGSLTLSDYKKIFEDSINIIKEISDTLNAIEPIKIINLQPNILFVNFANLAKSSPKLTLARNTRLGNRQHDINKKDYQDLLDIARGGGNPFSYDKFRMLLHREQNGIRQAVLGDIIQKIEKNKDYNPQDRNQEPRYRYLDETLQDTIDRHYDNESFVRRVKHELSNTLNSDLNPFLDANYESCTLSQKKEIDTCLITAIKEKITWNKNYNPTNEEQEPRFKQINADQQNEIINFYDDQKRLRSQVIYGGGVSVNSDAKDSQFMERLLLKSPVEQSFTPEKVTTKTTTEKATSSGTFRDTYTSLASQDMDQLWGSNSTNSLLSTATTTKSSRTGSSVEYNENLTLSSQQQGRLVADELHAKRKLSQNLTTPGFLLTNRANQTTLNIQASPALTSTQSRDLNSENLGVLSRTPPSSASKLLKSGIFGSSVKQLNRQASTPGTDTQPGVFAQSKLK